MTIICTVCGTANPDGTQYCEGCGVELASQAAASGPATNPTPAPAVEQTTEPAAAGPIIAAPSPEATARPPLTPPEGWTGNAAVSTAPPSVSGPERAAPEPGTASPTADPSGTAQTDSAVAGTPDLPLSPEPAVPTDPAAPVPDSAPAPAAPPEAAPEISPEAHPEVSAAPVSPTPTSDTGTATGAASLGIKKYGAATGESIPLQGERLVVGRFDASSGPVDIDLSGLGGQEHISRRHAELYREGGGWKVRDLGSTNGVYLKRRGEASFSPRLQEPAALSDGDELAFGNLMFTFQQG